MKNFKIVFVLVFALGIVFTSCTKDISGPVDNNFLQGKWNFNKSTISSSGFTVPYSNVNLKNESGCNKDYIEILASGVFKFGNYPASCTLDEKSGSWSLSGSNIVIAVAGTDLNDTFEIAKLDQTELILQIDQTYEGRSGTLNLYFSK